MDKQASPTASCPECGGAVTSRRRPHIGQLLLCPRCETILVVTAVSPLKFDWAFEEPLNLPLAWQAPVSSR